jgi:two-component system OmpR family sensor kinase
LRLRLTLWFVLGVAVVVLAGAVGIYAVLSEQLRNDLDSRLANQLTRYGEAVATAADEQSLLEMTRSYLSGPGANALRRGGLVFSLQTVGGSVLSNSDEVRPEELAQSRALLSGGPAFLVDAELGGHGYRVAGTAVELRGTRIGAVEIAGSRDEIGNTQSRVLLLLAVGGVLGCLLVGTGSWILVGRALEPVRRITETAQAISREDLTKRIDYHGPADEVGQLAATMDAMLDRLEAAFSAQEQFVSDVSHELRTPLTIVKGHLQVLDRQENPDPSLIRQEHALVIDELDRMDRLVADLLTLTRATRTDFLRKEPVEMDLFLTSLVAEGPHLGDREWRIDELPGGAVQADQDRLTQVFLNLMQNAVAHTSPGQVIALGGARDPERKVIRLWVRDEGEGMEEEVRRHVFERFYRGKGDAGGGRVGLGLAIARALVVAHGGEIYVESELGRGTRFTVELPA